LTQNDSEKVAEYLREPVNRGFIRGLAMSFFPIRNNRGDDEALRVIRDGISIYLGDRD